jgi:hypothetical protein
LSPEVYLISRSFLEHVLLQKELSMLANLIIRNDRDSLADSVNDKQDGQLLELLPLTMDQLGWVGGGEGIVSLS